MVTCALYHNVGPETAFERGLNISITPAAFETQIDWMAERYDFISLDQLLSGDLPPRPMLITFDDTFLSVVHAVRTVLAPRGIPSVYFINPGLLSPDAISLDSTLAWAGNTFGLSRLCAEIDVPLASSVGELVVRGMARYTSAERSRIKAHVLRTFGPPDLSRRAPIMSEADLPGLPRYGVAIGNHTATHVHCRSLTEAELQTEIVEARSRLEDLSNAPVRAFSVPYGHEDDLTPRVLQAVRSGGHDATFLVHKRSNVVRPAPDIWYRTSLQRGCTPAMSKHLRYLPLARTAKKAVFG